MAEGIVDQVLAGGSEDGRDLHDLAAASPLDPSAAAAVKAVTGR